MDLRRQVVMLDSKAIVLTRQEYRLLALLVQHGGEVVPRAILLTQVFGYAPQSRTGTLTTHIGRLRRKLGSEGRRIETILGKGYRFLPLYNSGNLVLPEVELPTDSVLKPTCDE